MSQIQRCHSELNIYEWQQWEKLKQNKQKKFFGLSKSKIEKILSIPFFLFIYVKTRNE